MEHRVTRFALTSLVVFCLAVSVRAGGPGGDVVQGPPPGWELVKITDDPEQDRHAAMNNLGQIVFSKRHIPNPNGTQEEIYLYDNGKVRRLTFNDFAEDSPDINDAGVIVWRRQEVSGTDDWEIMRWESGSEHPITSNQLLDFGPSIGNTGLIMWSGRSAFGVAELFEWRDGIVTQLTSNGLSNQCITINAAEDFTWVRYDFNAQPSWRSTIMCSFGGIIHELTDGMTQAQSCALTDAGVVGWSDSRGITLWEAGNVTVLPNTEDQASGPRLNNVGDIQYGFWLGEYPGSFLVHGGVTFQIAGAPGENFGAGDLNDTGQITLVKGVFPGHDVYLMWTIREPGDFTGDAVIDAFDFESLRNCMSNVECGVQMPPVCLHIFDFDQDGDIDFHDFGTFQRLVTPNP